MNKQIDWLLIIMTISGSLAYLITLAYVLPPKTYPSVLLLLICPLVVIIFEINLIVTTKRKKRRQRNEAC